MPIDDRTANRSYKLPNAANFLADDVQRLRDALTAIDADVYARYTKTEIDQLITNLIDGAPEALNTLKELATAVGNNPNFAATVNATLTLLGNADLGLQQQVTNVSTTVSALQSSVTALTANTPVEHVFTGNGTQTAFTLSTAATSASSLLVSVDGVVQQQADYTLSANGLTLTLSEAPPNGSTLRVYALGATGGQVVSQVAITGAITLPAGSTSAVAVTLANASYLSSSTSLRGVLGTVIGTLARSAGGAYTFAPATAPVSSANISANTLFIAGAFPADFNPINVSGNSVSENPAYNSYPGYLYAVLDGINRIAFAIKNDGSIYIPSALEAKAGVFQSLTAPGGTIDLDSIDTPQVNVLQGGTSLSSQAYNSLYAYAFTDANNRIAWGVKPDGTLFAGKTADLSISGQSSEAGALNAGGHTVDRNPAYANVYASALVDSNNRLAFGVNLDGSIVIPRLNAATVSSSQVSTETLTATNVLGPGGKLTACHASGGVFAVEQVGSDYEIFKYANGVRTQLTTLGSNHSPSVTAESPARILYTSTRTGSVAYHVMDQDGGRQALAHAPTSYVMWGDSLTGNLCGIIPNNGHNVVTQAFLDKGLTSLGNERRLVNVGIGSQTAVQIAARQGGLATTCQVTGGQIPASGSVGLTSVYPDLLFNPTLDGRLTGFPVTINGVAGTLTRVDATNYTFARSTTGTAVAAPGTTTIVPKTADASPIISVDLFAPAAFTGADLNEYTAIFWLGHNGVGGSNGETLLSLVNGCVAAIRNISKRFLILPIFNATIESGTPSYTSLQTNSWNPLASAYPANYYDIRADFIATAKTWMQANYPTEYASDWGQAFIGTRASAGSDSDYDLAKDMIPRALRADTVHLNSIGSDLFSELLAAKLQSLGW